MDDGMDPRITRSLGQIGRGEGRPTLIGAGEEMAREVSPDRAPSMWNRARRFVSGLRRTNRTQARGSRR
ncbi:MAG TPA: hypothetical protein VFP27_10960 [Mycobacterium sp.]|nr:hypothetical protein [Mycobacterium sp.]